MSYSFVITADTKADATAQIREKFDSIVAVDPIHVADKEAVIAAAQTFVRILSEPPKDDEIYVSINGSLGWIQGFEAPKGFLHVNSTINVSLRAKSMQYSRG